MTAAASSHEDLLLRYKPRPIRTEAQRRRAQGALEALMVSNPTRAASELIEVLSTLIEQFEAHEGPIEVPPQELLEHLREARGVSRAELSAATGIPRPTITNVLSGKRELSKANIRALSAYFGVSPAAFFAV